MLSGQLAINQGAEPSGPLIAPGKKVVAEVDRVNGRKCKVHTHPVNICLTRYLLQICAPGDFRRSLPRIVLGTFARLDDSDT